MAFCAAELLNSSNGNYKQAKTTYNALVIDVSHNAGVRPLCPTCVARALETLDSESCFRLCIL